MRHRSIPAFVASWLLCLAHARAGCPKSVVVVPFTVADAAPLRPLRERTPPLGRETVVPLSDLRIRGAELSLAGEEYPLRVVRFASGVLEAMEPLAARFFRVREVPAGLHLTEIEPPAEVAERRAAAFALSPPRAFRYSGSNTWALSGSLVRTQVGGSATLSLRSFGGGGRDVDYLRWANVVIAEAFVRNRPLTVADIELVNERLLLGPLANGSFTLPDALVPGVVRGSAPRYVFRRVMYPTGDINSTPILHVSRFLVDMTRAEIANGSPRVEYLPASEVPLALEAWIAAANRVDGRTPFSELVVLYRRFLLIHPFDNGNGRTARALLDLLAMRAGFGPVPHSPERTREVLYRDLGELIESFYGAYVSVR